MDKAQAVRVDLKSCLGNKVLLSPSDIAPIIATSLKFRQTCAHEGVSLSRLSTFARR